MKFLKYIIFKLLILIYLIVLETFLKRHVKYHALKFVKIS